MAADAHVSTALPSSNFGALPTINVGGGGTGLLRFDLGALPASTSAAKVVKATLVLYVNRIGITGAVDLHPVNGMGRHRRQLAGLGPNGDTGAQGPRGGTYSSAASSPPCRFPQMTASRHRVRMVR